MNGGFEILHPEGWKPARGYSNGLVATGRTVWLGGQIGWNGDQQFETDDFVGQVRQALQNVVAILAQAGGGPEHIVRLTWFITDKGAYVARQREIGEAYRSVMGKHFPAMSVVQVTALIEDRAKVEIEATAVLPEQDARLILHTGASSFTLVPSLGQGRLRWTSSHGKPGTSPSRSTSNAPTG